MFLWLWNIFAEQRGKRYWTSVKTSMNQSNCHPNLILFFFSLSWDLWGLFSSNKSGPVGAKVTGSISPQLLYYISGFFVFTSKSVHYAECWKAEIWNLYCKLPQNKTFWDFQTKPIFIQVSMPVKCLLHKGLNHGSNLQDVS